MVQRDLLSAFLGMLARPEFDPHTDEIVGDTPDLDLARKARSIGPEFTGWRSRVKARPDIEFGDTSARRCGHWSGSRLVASDVPGPTEVFVSNHHIHRLRPRTA
ncbi:MAG: hypothetical protein M0Z39_00285 [Actinomycetota bacterium]|nr:hypothetical protein [Actinomycetota bacterium]